MINIRNVREGVARRPVDCQSVAGGFRLWAMSLFTTPFVWHFYIKNRKTVSHVSLNKTYHYYYYSDILKILSLVSFVGVGGFFLPGTPTNVIPLSMPNKRVVLSTNTKKNLEKYFILRT